MDFHAQGSGWAVATPHEQATEAGAEAFELGGNAIDAAVAAAVTLAVVYPHMCGVGGDLFALVQEPEGDAVAVNGSGRAPWGADAAEAAAAGGGRMPERGPHTVTVPGAVGGWEALHRLGGALPWARLFARAIAFAYGGATVSGSLSQTLAGPDRPKEPGVDPLADIFAPDGTGLPRGAVFRQPALGASLERIAAEGSSAMYGGDLGERYASGLRAAGVPILPQDLTSHRTDLGAPLRARYRSADVLVHPPNSQGFVLLEMLAVIERLQIDPDPLGPDAGILAKIFRAASRDRDLHLADPETMRIHPSTLLDDGHLAALDDEVRLAPSGGSAQPPNPGGDTIALVTADAQGRAVSLIQSLFYGFGSGILEPETGIVAQNRGAGFTLDPEHANTLAPGKRPAHTLLPVLVQRDGRLEMTAGTMGGYGQPQINALNLLRTLDLGMSPFEAVSAPRWLVGGLDPDQGGRPFVALEADVPEVTRDTLGRAGFEVQAMQARDQTWAHDEALGHAHLIRSGPGGFDAGSDPRADGGAMAG